ncbi:MAG: ribosome maturation factor RimM, partial [Gordonia sp. (in: high G+C Gram-positive bacteria)]
MDLVIGRVVKTHGVRGELVVNVRTDDPGERFAVGTVLRGRAPQGGGEKNYTVTAA